MYSYIRLNTSLSSHDDTELTWTVSFNIVHIYFQMWCCSLTHPLILTADMLAPSKHLLKLRVDQEIKQAQLLDLSMWQSSSMQVSWPPSLLLLKQQLSHLIELRHPAFLHLHPPSCMAAWWAATTSLPLLTYPEGNTDMWIYRFPWKQENKRLPLVLINGTLLAANVAALKKKATNQYLCTRTL